MSVAVMSSALALALFLVPLAIAVFNLFLTDAQSTLERDVLHAAVMVDPAFSATDQTELPKPASNEQLGLYNASGKRVLGTGPATADDSVRLALTGQSTQSNTDGWIVFAVPVSSAESVTGAVRSAIPITIVWQRTVLVWVALLLVAAVTRAAGAFAARSVARRVIRPMEDIARAAQSLGNGQFEARTTPAGIPELDRAGAALNSTAKRLDDLVQRERQLSANASHQLRTPLTGLRMVLESALTDPDADLRATLAQAIERADQLDLTIDQLIVLGRGGASGAPVDATAHLDAADRKWRGLLAAQSRPLRVESDSGLPLVTLVPGALDQMLDVLIENALRHGTGEVTLRGRQVDGAVAIDVEDEGSGLAIGEEIFLHGLSHNGGSGLGLALARRLAEDHGGRLLLSARMPHTRFTVVLPAAGQPEQDS
ncbi:MAG: HAMP domain-containing sensor histidine kinase [Terrimesophilobacter sp.]